MYRKWLRYMQALILLICMIFTGSLNIHAETTNGEVRDFANLVIFVQFSDTADTNFMDKVDRPDIASDNGRSARALQYFLDESYNYSLVSYMRAISYGQMEVHSYIPQYDSSTGVITPVYLDNTHEYYEKAANHELLVDDVIEKLKTVDSGLNLDYDNDGLIDNIILVCAGTASDRGSIFTPQMRYYIGDKSINGKRVSATIMLSGSDFTYLGGNTGTVCHEFLHTIGFPDLYKEDNSTTPVGTWDIMGQNNYYLQFPLAYFRSNVGGWLNIKTITRDSDLTLVPATNPDGNQAFILKSPLSNTEFFVIEYRRQGQKYTADYQYEASIPGTGLIIYRIDTTVENASNHKEAKNGTYIFRVGDTTTTEAKYENLRDRSFFSFESGRTEFGSTDMKATIADNAIVFSDGSNSGIKITNIGSAKDTISCHVEFADFSNADIWESAADEYTDNMSTDGMSLAFCNDTLYGVYGNPYFGGLVTVRRDGSVWTKINSTDDYHGKAKLFSLNNKLYMICINGTDEAVIRSLSGNGWVDEYVLASAVGDIAATVSDDALQISLICDNGSDREVLVGTYSPASGYVQKDTIGTGAYYNVRISAANNSASVFFYDFDNRRIRGSLIDNEGIHSYEDINANGYAVPIYDGNNTYLVLDENSSGISIYKYNNGSWQVIKQKITNKTSGDIKAFTYNGKLYIQLQNQDNSSDKKVQMYCYNEADASLVQEGNNILSVTVQSMDCIVNGNTAYSGVFYLDSAGNGRLALKSKKLGEEQIKPNPDPVNPGESETSSGTENTENAQLKAFVKRLYSLVLGREADEVGLNSWVVALADRRSSGVDAGYGFVFSDECKQRGISNQDYVEMLYNTFMDRASDEGGKRAWTSQLDSGVDREAVLKGFILSEEFSQRCENCGIDVGSIDNVPAFAGALSHYRNINAELTKFVARCYTKALNREYETDGLEAWCREIVLGNTTPKQAAKSFIFSDEFVQKNLNNTEYVKVLYRTFMGREADEGGLNAWVNVLELGKEDRAKVLDGFADSAEFAGILSGFGL